MGDFIGRLIVCAVAFGIVIAVLGFPKPYTCTPAPIPPASIAMLMGPEL